MRISERRYQKIIAKSDLRIVELYSFKAYDNVPHISYSSECKIDHLIVVLALPKNRNKIGSRRYKLCCLKLPLR